MSGNKTQQNKSFLTDRFGRKHTYLRMSITNDCNFACMYCRPDDKKCEVSGALMNVEEIIQIAYAFAELGINKIRLTGGEPLLHKQFEEIIQAVSKLPVELALTTNGYLLDKYFHTLKFNGVKKLNISLDTLQKDRFTRITQRNAFDRVYANMVLAIKLGFEVKVNAVIMRGTNEDELIDFANLTKKYPIAVRFIEFMPFHDNQWNFGKTFLQKNIIETLSEKFNLNPVYDEKGTSNDYQIAGTKGRIGMISTLSHPFCDECNRIRITADGKIKNCLFGSTELDLIKPFRNGEEIKTFVFNELNKKPYQHGGNSSVTKIKQSDTENRSMFSIGG